MEAAELDQAAAELGSRLAWDEERRRLEILNFEAEWKRLFGPRSAAPAASAAGRHPGGR